MTNESRQQQVHTATWTIRDDDDGDGPYWDGFCPGDKDGDRLPDGQPLVMYPTHWPVGTRVTTTEPEAPEFYARLVSSSKAEASETRRLRAELTEALAALREAEAGLVFAGADQPVEEGAFVPAPTLALRSVRQAMNRADGLEVGPGEAGS